MDRISGTVLYTGLCAFILTFSASANARDASASGCSALADAVQTEVSALIRSQQFGAQSTRTFTLPAAVSAVSCGTATAVASSAFSTAFAGFGVDVDWNNGLPADSGDFCLSHRLDQCYPGGGGLMTAFPQGTVQDSWNAVSLALGRQMPLGVGSDIVYFSPAVLREALAVSLQIAVKPRYDPPPYCPPPLGPCRLY